MERWLLVISVMKVMSSFWVEGGRVEEGHSKWGRNQMLQHTHSYILRYFQYQVENCRPLPWLRLFSINCKYFNFINIAIKELLLSFCQYVFGAKKSNKIAWSRLSLGWYLGSFFKKRSIKKSPSPKRVVGQLGDSKSTHMYIYKSWQ